MACDQARVGQVVEIVRAELSRFGTDAVTEKELKSSKAQLRGELILGFESMDRRMSRMPEMSFTRNGCGHPAKFWPASMP